MMRFVLLCLSTLMLSFSSHLIGEENFLLIDQQSGQTIAQIGPGIDSQVTPCSTFKIPLSLIGFDSKLLKDLNSPSWPFQTEYLDEQESWRTFQNPKTWIKNSCVWYSQKLTSLLGQQKLQNYLNAFGYGNMDLSEGIAKAWLSASLKISLRGQVHFLGEMLNHNLPVSRKATLFTQKLLFMETLPNGWKLFGKTGFGSVPEHQMQIGWFVGWIQKGHRTFVFAYNIIDPQVVTDARIPRVKHLLYEHLKETLHTGQKEG